MTSKLTRERIELIANFHRAMALPPSHAEIEELARMALAAMDSEPVGTLSVRHMSYSGKKIGNQFGFVHSDAAMTIAEGDYPLYRHAQPASEREQVRSAHAEWSQATFGNVGPVGPLKHLSKEALEAAAEPGDLSEWADMQFLLWDAQRRAGITDEQITQAMIEKLAVNKQRKWPAPKDGEPRLHIKEQPSPAVPGKWIPVSERMPEVGDIVLTAIGVGVTIGETECSAANCRFFTSVISGRELPATHWMPLPCAPQEVKGE